MTSAVDERPDRFGRDGDEGEPDDAVTPERALLVARYGRGPRRAPDRARRQWPIVSVAVVAVLTAATVAFWGLGQAQQGADSTIETRVTAFRVPADNLAEADLSISVQTGYDLACAIEVQNPQHLIVGWRIIELDASEQRTRPVTVQVRTTQPADTVLVNRCWIP
ncbi:hypothetical protein GCM10011490_08530 [Pseudoclavibacter endophyticus]|uniref:DUF4307 domain-containing protein n=1 Tax=Pseudoclavibacter endophyticus TaxID=1778590 RepID=UPI001665613F|nr:DUF4307 domain-containing protein [Pseudoclavibacter endophyticus]GGA60643.1 hypothetical protein GCM10011490_08530 [Pseudoclavibacter endophyticus]